MPDTDFEIRGGGRSPKMFFRPFGPLFGLKIRGDRGPPGPSPGSATEKYGWTRDMCDTAFHKDMDKACENSSRKKRFPSKIFNWCYDYEPESETYDYEVFSHWIKNLVVTVNDKVKRCKAAADIYYKSVYHFGHAHFENVLPAWCSLPCAKKLGDPGIVLGV